MLNSTELEISTAHKTKMLKNKKNFLSKKCEYDQEIPQSQTAGNMKVTVDCVYVHMYILRASWKISYYMYLFCMC